MKRAKLKVRTYDVVTRAVEEGVSFGWHRFTKYHEGDVNQIEEAVREHMEREVMSALCEVVDFETSDELHED